MSRFATLDSLRNRDEAGGDGDDDRNEYYAGGARRDGGSGLAVVGGPNDRRPRGDGGAADEIFGRAESDAPAAGAAQRTITMYREGFTVDDGPFRRLDDPANAQFLSTLARGQVPAELAEGLEQQEGPVNVGLVDKRNQDYVPPAAPAYVAYGGSGQTAGGGPVSAAAVVGGGEAAAAATVAEVPEVDTAAPTTTLQLRLHDGRRVRATLNLTHTVAHLQAFIRREGAGDAPYMLMHGFPPVQITDFSQTLEQAGLKGAAISQKLAT